MEHALQHPLISAPLSMATTDEMMAKTNKSSLFEILENKVKEPNGVAAYIIDGQFLPHTYHLSQTYGGLARSILIQNPTKVVHIAFDNYPQPSIKDIDRDRRGVNNRTFVTTEPEQCYEML